MELKSKMKPVDELSPEWQEQGLCRRTPSIKPLDFFYAGRFYSGSKAEREHVGRLRSLCAACPVLSECKQWSFREQHGFWAGMTEQERADKLFERELRLER